MYKHRFKRSKKYNVKPRPEIFSRNQKFVTNPLQASNVTIVEVDPYHLQAKAIMDGLY